MSEYRVAVTLQRSLDENEIQQLHASRSESITSYQMEGSDVVLVDLHSPTSLAAVEAAEIQVQRSTLVAIKATQILPQ